MIDIPQGAASRQYAHLIEEAGPLTYRHVYPSAMEVCMHGGRVRPTMPVLVTVDSEGPYWAWWSSERSYMLFVRGAKDEVEREFARRAKEEDVSRELGALVRVRVETRCDCFACGGASGLGCEKEVLR